MARSHIVPRLAPVAALLALGSCVVDAERGPWLGECADTPEGVYSWGDVGIGSCLAGPTDVRFVEADGGTWLAVSNADPYRSFASGSVLLIDYDAIDRTAPRNYLHELPTFALPITDDDDGKGEGETAMLGQIGVLPGGRLIVPGRHTEEGFAQPSNGAQLRAGLDELYVLDVDPPSGLPGQTPQILTLRDDPYPVVVGDDGLAYVGNLTDHSVSVMAIDDGVELVDVAEVAAFTDRTWVDAPGLLGARSMAELLQTRIFLPDDVPDDLWTVTYAEGALRVYLPTAEGVWRHDGPEPTGFGATLLDPAPTGPDYGGSTSVDPFYFLIDGFAYSVFAQTVVTGGGTSTTDEFDGSSSIWRADGGSTASAWDVEALPVLTGTLGGSDALVAGPSVVGVSGVQMMYYDGRPAIDAPACIFRSLTEDGITFPSGIATIGTESCPEADLVTGFDEVAQPFARYDGAVNRFRMWFSGRRGDQWVVALSSSDDGVRWGEPRVVLELPDGSVGGPTVNYEGDHYRMVMSIQEPPFADWTIAQSVSVDGIEWSEPQITVDVPGAELPSIPSGAADVFRPVRAGALFSATSSWRIQGRDYGLVDARVVAGSGGIVVLPGFTFGVAHGHEVSSSVVPSSWARRALSPASVVEVGGVPTLFATATASDERGHVVALQPRGDALDPETRWEAVEPFDAIDAALAPAGTSATDPVVVQDAEGYVMFYALEKDGVRRIKRATSPDGLSWTREAADVVASGGDGGWDTSQQPHSVEATGGGFTLWYAGDDTSRFRIGAATSTDLRGPFSSAPGEFDPWQFAAGIAGSFDDSGVKDPLVLSIEGERHLFYSGFDGDRWSMGHAVSQGGDWVRRVGDTGAAEAGEEEQSLVAHAGLPNTFSAQGVESPVLLGRVDDGAGERLELLYAGFDGFALRLGRARTWSFEPDVVFADQRRPTTGDQLTFRTSRGGDGVSVIELSQDVDAFITDGIGMSAMELDPDRGMLYTASKLSSGIFAIDVRDDSAGTFRDDNVFDLEAVMRPQGGSAAMGFRGLQVVPERGLLYATATNPDGLWVFDLDRLVDDDVKQDVYGQAVAVLPLPNASDDAGERSQSNAGGSGMALAGPNQELLLVTHFRDNSLFVYDLTRGDVGEEVAYLPFLGENPHVVRVAPDGLTAVVANYTGDVVDGLASSTLVVIDLDPTSDTYLEPLTWIVNK